MPVAAIAEKPAGDLPARLGTSQETKRAVKVADRIVADVMAMGWPAGRLLGSEAELLDRFKVSRAVFREAVRLVEHQQVARTRRGPGGGLVITEPTMNAVIDAVVLYLYRVSATLDELFEARMVLEEIVTDLACRRLGERHLAGLRRFADPDLDVDPDPRALHALLASISANPALELFVEVFNRVTLLYCAGWQRLGPAIAAQMADAHARIAQAVIEGDAKRARRRMHRHLRAEFEFLREGDWARQLLPDDVVMFSEPESGKRAEAVARRIARAIVVGGMQSGQFVGVERDLIEHEGVSRAVLREAVRLLEHHQIARTRRGPGGGLFVFGPSAVAVAEGVAIYLARRGMRHGDLAELRAAVETVLAGLAAARIDRSGTARIGAALERERTGSAGGQPEAAHDLHVAVAGAAHSRALELVALVLIRLSLPHPVERLAPVAQDQAGGGTQHAHAAIAAAIDSGDRDLAGHLMRRHLDVLAGYKLAGPAGDAAT